MKTIRDGNFAVLTLSADHMESTTKLGCRYIPRYVCLGKKAIRMCTHECTYVQPRVCLSIGWWPFVCDGTKFDEL